MRAWRMTPQTVGCASRSRASSVRNPAPRPTLAELLREPAVAHPATIKGRVDGSNGTDQIVSPRKRGLLSRLGRNERLPDSAEVLLSEVEERVRDPWPRSQALDRSEEVEREPKRGVSRQIRVPGIHEVPPVGLHLTGKLLLVGAERRTEIEQELQLRSMLRSARKAKRVVGWLNHRAEAHSGRRVRIVELIPVDRHEACEVNVGIRSVACKHQVREDLCERLIGTGCITGQERIREVGKWILVRQQPAEGRRIFGSREANHAEEQIDLLRIGANRRHAGAFRTKRIWIAQVEIRRAPGHQYVGKGTGERKIE